jgi:hypothetical protein
MVLKCVPPMVRIADVRTARTPEKKADPFYSEPAYREWRELVISRARGVCQGAGCGHRARRMFADHIVEVKMAAPATIRAMASASAARVMPARPRPHGRRGTPADPQERAGGDHHAWRSRQ